MDLRVQPVLNKENCRGRLMRLSGLSQSLCLSSRDVLARPPDRASLGQDSAYEVFRTRDSILTLTSRAKHGLNAAADCDRGY